MAGLDIYCAVCCGPFKLPHNFPGPPIAGADSDSLQWLYSLCVLGRNLDLGGVAYLSGPGTAGLYNNVRVTPGSDPNAPRPSRRSEWLELSAYYDWDSMGSGEEYVAPFPVHCACWEVMKRALRARWRRKLNGVADGPVYLEKVRTAMQRLLKGGACRLAGMDYFEFGGGSRRDPLWEDDGRDDFEAILPWFLDPLTRIGVVFPQKVPSPSNRVHTTQAEINSTGRSPFFDLPSELLYQTLDELTSQDFMALMTACPALHQKLDDRYWKRRISADMPYLWELEERMQSLTVGESDAIDWLELWQRLLEEAYPASEGFSRAGMKDIHLGRTSIASRRRIWECVGQLLERCE
ncbi:hypothetical protein BAUCODRAFT_144492 [Baudoinia panamericana UAMH 10762]|uniref:F-box domain-containing protein n=1 Tax=Baudoinia panamericana (strain UAMH 10762) TaxID=717646 RepID=M2NNT4_BAUPA|nr:uncharacterized protein BAUCODRAFT_144492 [Baudoinia panamericana UAMH 10762]EMD00896.1 hypothetical protein BAUCODRAFT_144492 [Baudoinia panamericana UAMH 10762]